MSCNCHSCHPHSCNCNNTPPTPPICNNGEKCEEVIDAGCVEYTGDNIDTFGIVTGDRMDAILNKLDLNSSSQEIVVSNTSTVNLTGLVDGETTFTHTVNSATNSTTLILDSSSDITPGQLITGTNIDSNTKVLSITGSTIVLTKPVLGTVVSDTLTFTRSAGVGLASNPLIATVNKSTSFAGGENQVQLLSDGVYVPKGLGVRVATDDSLHVNVGGPTLTIVSDGIVRDAVFQVHTNSSTGAISSVTVLDGGAYSIEPTDITINSEIGQDALLSMSISGSDPDITITAINIVSPGTGYFDDHYLLAQAKLSDDSTNRLELKDSGSTGLYVSPKIKATSDDTIPDYLGNKLVAGSNITITPSTDTDHGKIFTIASTGGSGSNITVADTSTIDLNLDSGTHVLTANLILDNKNLVSPVITPGFVYKKNDGSTDYTSNVSAGQGYDPTDPANPIVDVGAKVSLDSYFTWHVSDSATQSAPTSCTGDFGTTLPTDNVASSPHITDLIYETTVVTRTRSVTISKTATGLNVVNNKVVLASGSESKTASISIRFKHKYYGGISSSSAISTSSAILNLGKRNFTDDGGVVTLTGINTSSTDYMYFCYPASFGALTNIIKNDSLPILGAFGSPTTVSVTNDAGLAVTYNVYRSNVINPFSDLSKLSFYL
jgi:hypothetical protein